MKINLTMTKGFLSNSIILFWVRYGLVKKRRKYSDVFWFALFHEIRHVLQQKKAHIIVSTERNNEIINNIKIEKLETDANKFAQDFLNNPTAYTQFIEKKNFSCDAIKEFAAEIKLQPGIVVGRLQREGNIKFSQFNSLK